MLLEFAVVIAASYLVGSIPFGYIAGRVQKGIDVRDYGSGATGATNVMRTLGKGAFVAVLGHDFPVYIGFRGGRGVATSFGVYAALALPVSVSLVAVALFIVLTFRYMSLMSIVTVPLGALVLLLLAVFQGGDHYTYSKTVFGAFATALVIVRHWGNIQRLVRGTEPKLGKGGGRRNAAPTN